jgi:hypothetical protein
MGADAQKIFSGMIGHVQTNKVKFMPIRET